MTDKPNVFREVFGDVLHRAPKPAPESPLVSDTESHAKLKRNLDLALDRHHDFMTADQVTAGDKRLALESANMTVKAALTTDRGVLKARADNTIERVLLRAIVVRRYHGRDVRPDHMERLKATPRAELEAALGQRWLKVYDAMVAATAPEESTKPLTPPPPAPCDPELQRRLNEEFGKS